MKAKNSNKKIIPFGGAVPVLKQIRDFQIPALIKKCLGTRVKQAKYGYDDVIIAWMLTNFCGGMRLDHITKIRKNLDIIPNLKLPSHDTLGRVMKSLSTEMTTTTNVTRNRRAIETFRDTNDNDKFADLLIQSSKTMKLLDEKKSYTLDVDAVFIETENFEAKYTKLYSSYGFYPTAALIEDLPVYLEMRNGNVAPRMGQKDFAMKCLKQLEDNNVKIGRFRADSGSYDTALMDFLEEENVKFIINTVFGKPKTDAKTKELLPPDEQPKFIRAIASCDNYEDKNFKTATTFWDCQIGEVKYTTYNSSNEFRLVIARVKNKVNPNKQRLQKLRDKKIIKQFSPGNLKGWKRYNGYSHKVIITNDWNTSREDIIKEYLKRGNSERKFDFLKNDCAWRLPPFSSMTDNTVFLYIAALTHNVYKGILNEFQNDVEGINNKTKLATFRFIFIYVSCQLVDGFFEFYNSDIPYHKLINKSNGRRTKNC